VASATLSKAASAVNIESEKQLSLHSILQRALAAQAARGILSSIAKTRRSSSGMAASHGGMAAAA